MSTPLKLGDRLYAQIDLDDKTPAMRAELAEAQNELHQSILAALVNYTERTGYAVTSVNWDCRIEKMGFEPMLIYYGELESNLKI